MIFGNFEKKISHSIISYVQFCSGYFFIFVHRCIVSKVEEKEDILDISILRKKLLNEEFFFFFF